MSFRFFNLSLSTLSVAALAFSGLASCKSAKSLFPVTPSATISRRLPALEVTADPGPLAMNDGALPDDPLKLFQAELKQNVLEPTDTATFGYVRLVVNQVHTTRTGRSLQAAQVATMMMPSILGAPLEWYKTDIQADVQVMNANGDLLGTYSGRGTSNVKVAMYHGYSQTEAPRLADVLALHEALNQIRPQLDSAARRLRPLLLAGGEVATPTLPPAAEAGRATRERAATERAATRDRALAEKALAGKANADRTTAAKALAEQAATKTAPKTAADRALAEKAAADKQVARQAVKSAAKPATKPAAKPAVRHRAPAKAAKKPLLRKRTPQRGPGKALAHHRRRYR